MTREQLLEWAEDEERAAEQFTRYRDNSIKRMEEEGAIYGDNFDPHSAFQALIEPHHARAKFLRELADR